MPRYDEPNNRVRVEAEELYNAYNQFEQRRHRDHAIVMVMQERIRKLLEQPADVDMKELRAPVIVEYRTYDLHSGKNGKCQDDPLSFEACVDILLHTNEKSYKDFKGALYFAEQMQNTNRMTAAVRERAMGGLAAIHVPDARPLRALDAIKAKHGVLLEAQQRLLQDHQKGYQRRFEEPFLPRYSEPKIPEPTCSMEDNFSEAYAREFAAKLGAIFDFEGQEGVRIAALEKLLKEHCQTYKDTTFGLFAHCNLGSLQGQVKELLCDIAEQIAEAKGVSSIDILLPDLADDDPYKPIKERLKSDASPGSLLEKIALLSSPAPSLSFKLYELLKPMSINTDIFDVKMAATILNGFPVKDLVRMSEVLKLTAFIKSNPMLDREIRLNRPYLPVYRNLTYELLDHLDPKHLKAYVEHHSPGFPNNTIRQEIEFTDCLMLLSDEKVQILLDVVKDDWLLRKESMQYNFRVFQKDDHPSEWSKQMNQKKSVGLSRYVEKIAPDLHTLKECSPESFLWLFSNLSLKYPLAFEAIFTVPQNLQIILSSEHLERYIPFLPKPQLIIVAEEFKRKNPDIFSSEEGKALFYNPILYKSSNEQLLDFCHVCREGLIGAITNDPHFGQVLSKLTPGVLHSLLTGLDSVYITALLNPTPETLALLARAFPTEERDSSLLGAIHCAVQSKNIGFILEVLYQSPNHEVLGKVDNPNDLRRAILLYANQNAETKERFVAEMSKEPSSIKNFFATVYYEPGVRTRVSRNKEKRICEEALLLAGTPREDLRIVRKELQPTSGRTSNGYLNIDSRAVFARYKGSVPKNRGPEENDPLLEGDKPG